MFPWQSGSDGQEETDALNLNPRSQRWVPDNSYLQRHVGSAIAYNVWQYFQVTHDIEFLQFYGAELILEIARFWSSMAIFNDERGRYEIRGVMGPDEFHEGYPDAATPGLNNNAYTNVMAVWVLCRAMEVLDLLSDMRRGELTTRLGISSEEIARWDDISRRMYVPFHDDGDHQPVRGLRDAARARLGGLSHPIRQYPAPRSHSGGGERQPQPLQTVETGRRGDVVLSVFRRRNLASCSRVWVIRSITIRFRRTSPTMQHARPTAPRYAAWSIPGFWRARTGRAR